MKTHDRIAALGQVMQLAFVPSDFDETLRFWTETMGAGPFFVLEHNVPEWAQYNGVDTRPDITMALGHWGDLQIEVIKQLNDAPSPYLDWRRAGGEGLHHVCVLVDDMAAAKRTCTASGGKVVYDGRAGETLWSYVETGGGAGSILEMIQHAPPSRALMDMIRDAARGWDGRDPIRPLHLA
jgi:catechol 2,3-dioxygenase-like lactoylglutathione lyase family enzyme